MGRKRPEKIIRILCCMQQFRRMICFCFQRSAKIMSLQLGGSPLALCRSVARKGNLRKTFHTSASKRKALQNWKRPSIDEMGIPTESHSLVFARNNKKYNLQLLAGAGLFGFTTIVAINSIELNGTPAFVKSTGFVTKTPESIEAVQEVDPEETVEEATPQEVDDAGAIEAERIAAEEAIAAEAARVAAVEAAAAEEARIAAEEAAAVEAARIAAEEAAAAEAARIAAEEAAAAEAAKVAAEEAAATEVARIAAEESAAAEKESIKVESIGDVKEDSS